MVKLGETAREDGFQSVDGPSERRGKKFSKSVRVLEDNKREAPSDRSSILNFALAHA